MSLERLRLDELAGAWVGDRSTPFQIGLLGVLDAAPFRRPDGITDLERVADEVARRAALVPQLRRRVVPAGGLRGRPVWAEDPGFDPREHVAVVRSVPRGDLGSWVAARAVAPLDPDRPLWRVDVVGGLPDGRLGLLVVVHHVLADGRGGLRIVAALLDDSPARTVEPAAPRTAPPLPSGAELLRDNLASLGTRHARGPAPPRHGGSTAGLRAALQDFRGPEPPTTLPDHVGPGRRLVQVAAPLDDLLHAARSHGVTLNDLLLTAVTDGLRELLSARGELTDGMQLRTTVPVASGPGQAAGMLVVPLPVGEPDATVRLNRIHDSTVRRKARLEAAGGEVTGALELPLPLARLVVRQGRRWGSRHVSLTVSNVPGPTEPLWLAGARMTDAIAVAPLVPHVPLAIAALSYAGSFVVSVNADAAVHDLDVMGDGLARALARYGDGPPVTVPRPRRRTSEDGPMTRAAGAGP